MRKDVTRDVTGVVDGNVSMVATNDCGSTEDAVIKGLEGTYEGKDLAEEGVVETEGDKVREVESRVTKKVV